MAMFKKVFDKTTSESIFPQKTKANVTGLSVEALNMIPEDAVNLLLTNQDFVQQLQDSVTNRILDILVQRYDFTPTDKYLEEAANKKKYIGQLDSYLHERREINSAVETELQVFLQETTSSLSRALDLFTTSIQERIKQAEKRHGVDSIKHSLLGTSDDVGLVK